MSRTQESSNSIPFDRPMKPSITVFCHAALSVAIMFSFASCVAPYGPNQSYGSVLGAGTGALAGAVIGNQSGRPLEGAAIGGALGALAGSAIGNAQDQMVYGPRQPVYYGHGPAYHGGFVSPAPIIVQRRVIHTGFGGGWNRGFGGGFGGGWGRGFGGGGWGGGYCAPPPCW